MKRILEGTMGLALATSLLLAGCGGKESAPAGGPSPAKVAGGAADAGAAPALPTVRLISGRLGRGSAVGQAAPVFAWTGPDGKRITLADLAREKPTLVVFWQTTCSICEVEIPHLNEFYARHGDRAHLLSVNVLEKEAKVRAYIAEKGIQYPVLRDAEAQVAEAYHLPGVPTLVVVDASGKVVYYGHVFKDARRALEPLLRRPA